MYYYRYYYNNNDYYYYYIIYQKIISSDIKSLARAAVSGDETALDMFSWKRGSNKIPLTSLGPQEALTYFVGGAKG